MRLLRNRLFVFLCVLCVSPVNVLAAEPLAFEVVHEHGVGSCRGRLLVDESGIRFESERRDHSREWKFVEIQDLRLEPGGMRVLTYEDRRWWFGADRAFQFRVTGEEAIWRRLRDILAPRLERRLVVAHAEPPGEILYRFAAKHRHGSKGCEGVLAFGERTVSYASDQPGESRTWSYGDIESISSSGPFELTLNTYERQSFHYGSRRAFEFQLKEPLSEAAYNELWRKVNTASAPEALLPKAEGLEPPERAYDRLSRLADEAAERIFSARPEAPQPPVESASSPVPDLEQVLHSLARVESNFNPLVLSPKGARGVWQFMPDTARRYGLRVDARVDERTDVEKSRLAAAGYLTDLYSEFRDWKLVLAAYNAGEQRIRRVIERTGIRDFSRMAHLRLLPEETRRYVPEVFTGFAASAMPTPVYWFALTAPPVNE